MRFSYLDKEFDPKTDRNISRWVLLLPGSGCSWAKKSGGCFMCGFKTKIEEIQKGQPASHRRLMTIFRLGKLITIGKSPQNLTIYNGGSFLNDEEIPLKTQLEICRQVARHATIKKLFVESRPEFVTEEKIGLLVSILKGKVLEVGIGLECQSDEIRTKCIHKGFLKKDYEKAAAILKHSGAELLTYVFLKPIFLTEKEAVEEAIATIEYAFLIGSDEVALESAFIQKGTKMEEFYSQGEYKPPWLWSIVEVLKNTYHLGTVRIGGFEDEPRPIDIPRNCPKCSSLFTKLFEEYKKNGNVRLFDELDCECKQTWRRDFSK
jgi:archaeosine synthase beta-subunit